MAPRYHSGHHFPYRHGLSPTIHINEKRAGSFFSPRSFTFLLSSATEFVFFTASAWTWIISSNFCTFDDRAGFLLFHIQSFLLLRCKDFIPTSAVHTASLLLHLPCFCTVFPCQRSGLLRYPRPSLRSGSERSDSHRYHPGIQPWS